MNENSSSIMNIGVTYNSSSIDKDFENSRPKRFQMSMTHRSMKSLAEVEGIPQSHIRACKTLNLDGFKKDNRIDWEVLKPLYEANIERIKEIVGEEVEEKDDNYNTLKKEKLRLEIEIKELDIKQKKKENIPIEEINDFMVKFALQLNGLLIAKIVKELPPRTMGKGEEEVRHVCKETINEIVTILKKNISDWNPSPK